MHLWSCGLKWVFPPRLLQRANGKNRNLSTCVILLDPLLRLPPRLPPKVPELRRREERREIMVQRLQIKSFDSILLTRHGMRDPPPPPPPPSLPLITIYTIPGSVYGLYKYMYIYKSVYVLACISAHLTCTHFVFARFPSPRVEHDGGKSGEEASKPDAFDFFVSVTAMSTYYLHVYSIKVQIVVFPFFLFFALIIATVLRPTIMRSKK